MFTHARPVWAHHSRESLPQGDMNNTLCFKTVLPAGNYQALAAAADVFQLYAGGVFIAAGPARAAHSFARCERLNFTLREEGPVIFAVASYNVFNYCYIKQPGFFAVKFTAGGLMRRYGRLSGRQRGGRRSPPGRLRERAAPFREMPGRK